LPILPYERLQALAVVRMDQAEPLLVGNLKFVRRQGVKAGVFPGNRDCVGAQIAVPYSQARRAMGDATWSSEMEK
jgi:hypothetical protein